ncbi:glycine oxidase ThiO [Micromonospora sediminimaris]|uniref:glycine oxidase n=1 Tax=Micromonospora sediminimaris TaxID=547162 RepID=A0A9W5URI5_9ACTN|nr:glycine oxidase ThiO [Micromonospora sediminimaris]GIJ31980.1 glycine oxidase ThiO [Micromonospora sediminimaris]SFC70789.1 glycine oxidase [Micromonospora sediminimaris]
MTGRPATTNVVSQRRPDVAVVGGGPIGWAVAWRCAARGLRVVVHDPAPGSGASHVAAGMLAPVAEAYFGERELTALLTESAGRWPGFAAELTEVTGADIGYRTEGTLMVGLTVDDLAEARRLWAYQQELGLPVTPLRPSPLRDREPALAPRVRGGALAATDHQVDPRRLVPALRLAAERAGAVLVAEPVRRLSDVTAGATVVAAGCGSAALTGLPVRPVKGQVLRLRAPDGGPPGFRHVIRGYVDGEHVYLVPRDSGEVVVGATVEERSDLDVSAGAVLRLLRAAVDLLPEIAEYDLVETLAGLRPGTPDNAPILGPLPGHPDVLVATGHHRHGIVLTPVTADLITDLVTGEGNSDTLLAPFRPDRFADPPGGLGAPVAGTFPHSTEENSWN